jgi:simple sugar transport system ATP-binding protein
VRFLSGGNLQRLILAREISGEPRLLVAVQPTRGLDVGAIESVQRLLLAQRQAGAAILLISEELEELFALSDRLVVLYEGEIVGELDEENWERVSLMMTGHLREPVGKVSV